MAKVEIDLKQATNGSTVKVDGVEMKQVRTIAVRHTAGDIPRLYLEIVPTQMSIIGEADVHEMERCGAD